MSNPSKDFNDLLEYTKELVKAVTGLTPGGSEYFIRKRFDHANEVYLADIPACVDAIRKRFELAHNTFVGRVKADKECKCFECDTPLPAPVCLTCNPDYNQKVAP